MKQTLPTKILMKAILIIKTQHNNWMKISIFREVKINVRSEVNQCFQWYSLIKTLHKKNIFNTFLFESNKETQN